VGPASIAELTGASVAAGSFLSLILVGLLVWRRTAPVRRRRPSREIAQPLLITAQAERGPQSSVAAHRTPARASPTTHLAWVGGTGLLLALVARIADGPGAGLVTWGGMALAALVVVSGWRDRVTFFRIGDESLGIERAHRRPVLIPWDSLRWVGPPRTPLGGWRIEGARDRITLMPSDLLGRETVLDDVVLRLGEPPGADRRAAGPGTGVSRRRS
jgi:hypothetical protein